jgi:hypothetical protein
MSSNVVAAITIGQRDLQIFAVGTGKPERLSVDVNDLGFLHRAVLEKRVVARLWVPDASSRPTELDRGPRVSFRDGRVQAPPGYRLDRKKELPKGVEESSFWFVPEEAGDEPAFWFLPGVVGEALEEIVGTTRPARIILFHTDRGAGAERSAKEPVAAAPLLADWLKKQGFDVRIVCVLGPGEDLHVQDEGRNKSLLPLAAHRIDEALWEAAREIPNSTCDLYTSAGIPEFSQVVQASAQFRFPAVRHRHSSEDRGAARIPTVKFTAVQVLQARKQACQLVRRGEFEAAGVLAAGFASPGEPGNWVRAVRMAASYFRGYQEDAGEQAKGSPQPLTAAQLRGVIGETKTHSLHVALRAEAALRRRDVLAAASLTATFLDVVMIDAVDSTLRKVEGVPCADTNRRGILWDDFRPDGRAIYDAAMVVLPVHAWIPRPRRGMDWSNSVNAWIEMYGNLKCHDMWQKVVMTRLIRDLSGRGDLADALDHYNEALNRWHDNLLVPGVPCRPADLRNRIVHSLPTQDELDNVIAAFAAPRIGLWRRQEDETLSFLAAGSRAATVFEAIGVRDAWQRYEALVAALTADIEGCPLVPDEGRP